jgi:hypothetical protein
MLSYPLHFHTLALFELKEPLGQFVPAFAFRAFRISYFFVPYFVPI